ncbi:MAG: 16S rRNA (cytidine(1402)-2'-O)-methyltransferase, partial [Ignavibacteria bacterium]|nr:16S rRNA (cytidine(1402)-2'-O)-methyltransferase [Ignavibacteria bacterium]
LMETPYRLKSILTDIVKIFGNNTNMAVGFDLTLPKEKYLRGTSADILKIVETKNLKGEFVIIINNS